MKNILKKILVGIVLLSSSAMFVNADESYDVYNYDRWGEAIPSQAGYIAERSVSGLSLGIGDFSSLSDIFLSQEGLFYIADTGNNRIVVVDEEFNKVVKILDRFTYNSEKITLNKPGSIFVSDDNMLYIADTENSRVLKVNSEGKVELIVEKPVSDLYPSELTFLPQRVIVDKAGFIYVVVNNITSGAVMYNNKGEFMGFYGANRVQETSKILWNYFWKLIANENMRKYMTDTVPSPITSFDIDKDGFIYTCSNSLTQDVDAIKKVNAAGYNLFADTEVHFGDYSTPDYSNNPQNAYVDIDIGCDGIINCLDYTTDRIFQYDEDCNLLFIIGDSGDQLGTFKQVSAIESDEENLYVADSQKNTVTVFRRTVFGSIVHEATALYNAGYYDEALGPWFEVLKRDGNYQRAYIGISSALINQGKYEEAMKYAELANSQRRYNRAFEGYRTDFINEHFVALTTVTALIVAGIVVIVVRKKRKGGSRA